MGVPSAWPLYEEALEIRRRVLGPDHPHTAVSLINLGALCQSMGVSEEAYAYYERRWKFHGVRRELIMRI